MLFGVGFSALQRAENSSILRLWFAALLNEPFQCSSASRKFLNSVSSTTSMMSVAVSVLFSEPKIPQSFPQPEPAQLPPSVSVLFSEPKIPQSTIDFRTDSPLTVSVLFSEPKIPQCSALPTVICNVSSFSALQRAENSSITYSGSSPSFLFLVSVLFSEPKIPQSTDYLWNAVFGAMFQCSSASRKFLNDAAPVRRLRTLEFQCSSASRKFLNGFPRKELVFEIKFQCSSASRKFLNLTSASSGITTDTCFSALQRAENSSMKTHASHMFVRIAFQCSSASRKFLNVPATRTRTITPVGFSALQRAENSSIECPRGERRRRRSFSALQRAENSSISRFKQSAQHSKRFQCSSASRKFLNLYAVL